jgi:hypothetical protein
MNRNKIRRDSEEFNTISNQKDMINITISMTAKLYLRAVASHSFHMLMEYRI